MKKKSFFGFAAAILLAAGLWSALPQPMRAQNGTSLLNFDWNLTPSVETYQMSRYGNQQHALYTGAMTFSIPIYTYKDPDFEIPVSLEYNYDGYKIALHSGTVGMGWYLRCGGVITREIRGEVDECTLGYVTQGPQVKGYWYTDRNDSMGKIPGYRFPGHYEGLDWTQGILGEMFGCEPVFRDTLETANLDPLGHRFAREYDTAPDIYHFSFLGFQGDFIIDNFDHSCKVYQSNVSLDRIKVLVEMDDALSVHPIITIRIDGYEYVFGGDAMHIEYCMSAPDQGTGPDGTMCPITAWRLSSITAPNGRVVTFGHTSKYQLEMTYCESFTPRFEYYKEKYTARYIREGELQTDYESGDVLMPINRTGHNNCAYRCPLKEIAVDGEVVLRLDYEDKAHKEFTRSAFRNYLDNGQYYPPYDAHMQYEQEKRLSGIYIAEPEEHISLTQDYSQPSNGHSPKMFLTSVQSTSFGSYTFAYNGMDTAFPPIDCYDIDHWGYWNGQDLATYDETVPLTIPWKEIPLNNYHQQDASLYNLSTTYRDADFFYSRKGALTRIVYPTGGSTDIEYESNSASRLLDRDATRDGDWCYLRDNTIAFSPGGIRVKKMTDHTHDRSYERRFTYHHSVTDTTSSGIVMVMPRYGLVTSFTGDHSAYNIGDVNLNDIVLTRVIATGTATGITNQSNYNLIKDSPIAYSAVQEHHPDGSVTEYQFYTWADYPDSYNHNYQGNLYSVSPIITAADSIRQRNRALTLPPSHDRSAMRGEQKKTIWYDASLAKIKECTYEWELSYPVEAMYWCNTVTSFTRAMQYGMWRVKTGETVIEYENLSPLLSQTTWQYDSNYNLIKESLAGPTASERISRYYRRIARNDRFGTQTLSSLSDVVQTAFHDSDEYVIAGERAVYAQNYNPNPTRTIRFCVTNPIRVISPAQLFNYAAGQRGLITDITYDGQGHQRIVRIDLPGGSYVGYTWDNTWKNILKKEENDASKTWLYTWVGHRLLSSLTDPSGIRTSYEYDGANRLRTVRDGQGSKMAEYAYNLVSASDATTGADAWNYIRSYTYADASGTSRAEDLRYYDGLGDPLLDVAFGGGGGGRNLVTRHETDSLRRVDARAWLPIGVSTSDDPVYMTPQYMDETTFRHWYMLRDNDTHPFVETVYGTSPEGKPRSVQQAGDVFRTAARKTLITRRVPNPAADSVFRIVPFVSNSTTAQQFSVSTGGWVTGDLLCECTVDEDGRKTETYTDCFGKTVLLRRWNGAQRLDTYYVYDLCDRPVLVLQPQGSKDLAAYAATGFDAASDIVRLYGFQYVYDGDGTLVRRRIPGGCWEDFVYDARQRKRYFTDAALLENGLYIRYDYDTQDRIVRETLLRSPIGITPENVRSSYVSGGAGSVDAHFSQVRTLRECKYWGDTGYTSLSAGGIPAADQAGMAFLRGLPACETVWESPATDGTLTTNAASLTRRYGYDHRGRIIYVRETDGPGWMLTRRMTYDFNGHLLTQSERLQSPEGGFAPENAEAWTYDTRGRVLSYSHSYGGSQMTAVTYTYDDLGRLCAKSYDGGKAAQTFSRNLQGWSTGSSMTWGGTALFTEALSYYDPVLSTTEPLYTGHISEALSAHQGRQQVRYSYAYDGAGRLSGARLFLPSVGAENPAAGITGIAYDRNGNLLGYTGKEIRAMTIDLDYGFTYSGNRLSEKTLHRRTGPIVYPDRTDTFSYDLRGNLTGHGEKGLEIRYNLLNLPMSVQQADSSDMARFIYLSDGTKVGAVRGDSQRISYRGSYLLSGHSSLSQAVESVRWAEGVCATRTDGLGMGDYLYVTDHLGNVRSTVALYSEATAAPGTVVLDRSDYLPFGERVADLTAFSLTRPFTAEGDLHRWHLGGKEEVPEGGLNLLDFGARYYDPALCRWTSLDPLSNRDPANSPYEYCANNPIRIIDPFGLTTYVVGDQEYDLDDGLDDYVTLSADEYSLLESLFNSDLNHYGLLRDSFKDQKGYITGSGNPVLAASYCWGMSDLSEYEDGGLIPVVGGISSISSSVSGIVSSYVYNPERGRWMGKNLKRYTFEFNGNQHTGGRLKWAKKQGAFLKKASTRLGYASIFFSGYQFIQADTVTERWEYGIDIVVGTASMFYPAIGLAYIVLQPAVYYVIEELSMYAEYEEEW